MHHCSNKIASHTVTPILLSPNCPEESPINVWFSDGDVKLTLHRGVGVLQDVIRLIIFMIYEYHYLVNEYH